VDNTDTTELATLPAQLEAALKVTSAREFALLAHGHTTTDATETAQLNTPPMMLVLILALLEQPSKMESARLEPKAAHLVNSTMPPPLHA
jgi:hypothetical protein